MIWVKFNQTKSLENFLEITAKFNAEFDLLQINQDGFGCALNLEMWGKISSFIEKPFTLHNTLSRISLIGQGLRSNPWILERTSKIMKDLPIIAIDLTQIRLSLLTSSNNPELLVQKLHDDLILGQ